MWWTNRLLWHTNSDFYGVQTPPKFMPYEPFLLGVGVVFNLLMIYVNFRIDWTECPRDTRISMGQTGRVLGMVAVQKWGCPSEFLYVTLFIGFFFSLPRLTFFRVPFLEEIPVFLWGDPVQTAPQNPGPASSISSTKRSESEVLERRLSRGGEN